MSRRDQEFPLVEVFGYAADATSPEALDARERKWCRFLGKPCQKWIQYRFAYCSVSYAAAADDRKPRPYAVCDHRVSGPPVDAVVADHFGLRAPEARIVPEIGLMKPKMSFDYVAYTASPEGEVTDVVAIETQALDIRGGGVGPAFEAWTDGKMDDWRAYFTRDATKRGRRGDKVAYGVNMANVYKRIGMQVAVKGAFLKGIGVPFYVVMQHRPFEYLRTRIAFEESKEKSDITFVTFDYSGERTQDGRLHFRHMATVHTPLASYVAGLTGVSSTDRALFLQRVKRKAGLPD